MNNSEKHYWTRHVIMLPGVTSDVDVRAICRSVVALDRDYISILTPLAPLNSFTLVLFRGKELPHTRTELNSTR